MSEKAKARRTAPRKAAKPPTEQEVRGNRARRREAIELASSSARRPQSFPAPEDDTGRYRP